MKKKEVVQYSRNMEELRTFSSIKEAQALYHISHISLVCRGKRNSDGGYIWRYLDDRGKERTELGPFKSYARIKDQDQ